MSDYQASQRYNQITIAPGSNESCGIELARIQSNMNSSNTYPAANLAIYIPFVCYQPMTIVKIGVMNGTVVSGNIDAGIYDDQQNRIISKGSTAMAGTSAIQTLDITDTAILPGVYYIALCCDNTTATFGQFTLTTVPILSSFGILNQAVGAVTLPNPATFAACTNACLPMVYLTARTLI